MRTKLWKKRTRNRVEYNPRNVNSDLVSSTHVLFNWSTVANSSVVPVAAPVTSKTVGRLYT